MSWNVHCLLDVFKRYELIHNHNTGGTAHGFLESAATHLREIKKIALYQCIKIYNHIAYSVQALSFLKYKHSLKKKKRIKIINKEIQNERKPAVTVTISLRDTKESNNVKLFCNRIVRIAVFFYLFCIVYNCNVNNC